MPRRLLAAPDRSVPRLLVGVRSLDVAVEAADAGADLVDAKDPDGGALGALPPDRVRAIAEAVRGRTFVSAAAGQAGGMGDLVTRLRVVAACGVDMAKVALPPALAADPDLERACQPLRALATPAVAVLFAEDDPDPLWLPGLARAGFAGAMIDTRGKAGLRLTDHRGMERLARFVATCRALGLLSGLAGSLDLEDIPRLAPLRPTYLGFCSGLAVGGNRRERLDPDRVADAVRRLDPAPVAA